MATAGTHATTPPRRTVLADGARRALRLELPPLLRLAVPVILAEVAWMTMSLVDTMMVGRVSAEAIGAVSIGSHLFFAVAMAGGGILLGLDTLMAQAYGAGRTTELNRSLVQGLYLATALAGCLMLALAWVTAELHRLGIERNVLALAVGYLDAANWGLLPLLLFLALRRYLQAIGQVRPIMLSAILANLVNVVVNWVLIYGNLGAPALGAVGAAWATTLSRAFMLGWIAVFVLLHARRENPDLFRVPLRPDARILRRVIGLGLPATSQVSAEVGVFAAATLLAGRLDAVSLAAHQIALGAAAMAFMVPLGISAAGAVRVGQAIGRRDRDGAARAGWTALAAGASFMTLSACVFVALPTLVIRAFTTDPAVIATGASLLGVAAVFQLFDGLQVVGTGILRGAGDTRTGMLAGIVGYWVLGLPVGALLCFRFGLGVIGLWVGLSTGLIAVAVVLVATWAYRMRSAGVVVR